LLEISILKTENTITEGVLVRVRTTFREDISQVNENAFFFNYHIEIENHNSFTVQLLHRDWFIRDSLSSMIHVGGEGVVGQQPILGPGDCYQYTSGCELNSEIGSMYGFYTFLNLENNDEFRVDIPNFQMIFPGRLN
jgi:ApaG protein